MQHYYYFSDLAIKINMKKFVFLMIACSCTFVLLFSQQKFEGIVIDQETQKPIKYVNIGVINKENGTVTNRKGGFELVLEENNSSDSIRISSLGYDSKTYSIIDFQNLISKIPVISLESNPFYVEEVVIMSKKLKTKTKGNKTQSKFIMVEFPGKMLGTQIGRIIKTKKDPTYIKDFNIYILNNPFDSLAFRVNIYDEK